MKTWLITGASSGIGKEIAKCALANGDQVIVSARSIERLEDLVAIAPDRVLPVKLEVTNSDDRHNIVEKGIERFGKIDVLVNNAGRGYHAALEDTPMDDMKLVFDTNYFGPVALIQEVLPYMRKQNNGVIVNLSSMGVHFRNSVSNAFYVASKAALDETGMVLRNEVKDFHIQVMTVEPGTFRTNFRLGGIDATGNRNEIYKASYQRGDSLKKNPFTQNGDPKKAGKFIVECVNKENVPEVLVLGKGMVQTEIDSLQQRIDTIKECIDMSEAADFED